MKLTSRILMACLAFTIALAVVCGPAVAQNVPSSDLLLPYFEVDAANPGGLTTLFAVGNATDKPVDVLATVHTNWGIAVLEVPFILEAREVRTVNLRDWFRTGGSPTRALAAPELKHLAAAASGQRSPKDNLYYSSEVRPDLQVGYVILRTQGNRPDALWGDWFNVDVAGNLARGDVLANIDRSTGCPGLCQRHLLRYLSGGGFDGGTEIIIWRQTQGKPSANPAGVKMQADATAFSEPGQPIENRQLALLPVEKVLVSDLKFEESFGSLDLESEVETFIAVQHTSESRYSVGLTTYCLPRQLKPGPGIELLKLTNGEEAKAAPGPSLPIGSTVTWEYLVANTGDVELTGIVVEDDQEGAVACPDDTLAPGESMTCTATGTVKACQYTNIGSVSGVSPSGTTVNDSDTSHYFGDDGAALALAILLNGKTADSELDPVRVEKAGDTLNWIFKVTNTGKVRLTGIQLTGINTACPKGALEPGEAMDCTATGKALPIGKHSLPVAAKGKTSCSEASADSAGYYTVPEGECVASPAIQIKKSTNGQDADTAPGPQIPVGSPVTWTYVVTNTGDVALAGVKVSDDKGVAVSCPKAALQPGESMTCTGSGTAQAGQYRNVGAVTGTPPCGNPVADDDPSHYYGTTPGLTIMKLTNGHDANTAPGPQIPAGSAIVWEYKVTNTGNVALGNVKVTDDKGVAVTCPKTTLAAGESMTCTGSGKAQACQYENLGTVTGKTPGGDTLSASDPSHYYGTSQPAIDVEVKVNGQDADSPKGPEVAVGSALSFTYIVKNTGDTTLTGVQITDSKGVAVSCPKTTLAAGESMTCTGSGTAQAGQYSATGSASGNGACGQQVADDDPVHYYGSTPGLTIVKLTNGHDANTAPGPQIPAGSAIVWEYKVTNTGDVALGNVKVTDDKGVAVTCPKTTLAAGESMTCTGSGKAQACQYANLGTVTGKTPTGETLTASDPSHYYGTTQPAIDIETKVNGQDADSPKGPEVAVGSALSFTYIVKNTGDTTLTGVQITDSKGVAVSCPKTTLAAGESMTCTGSGTAQAGQYSATGSAKGTGACGQQVSDDDPVHYYGLTPGGTEGCTPGYWKNHTESWPPSGFSPSQKVQSVFGQASLYPSLGSSTLHQSLYFDGGSDLTGASGILLRAATAALLNSAHSGVDYPWVTAQVISDVNAALASSNRETILALASALDQDNNLGCPLN